MIYLNSDLLLLLNWNRQAIQDKYCIRGAEWGVGDCSAEGMTQQEREEFIMALKKKAGIE
ncbi:hypothetical protein HanOQP8_Chr12g0461311 [Helianthus annuus]|nr:hypothetical protein HanOQP8_Chr12g0461311 [Helianthus annuus]